MNAPPLHPGELELLRAVFRRHPEIREARLFRSRAQGTHTSRSDDYIAVWGDVDALRAEAIAAELDELPLPYRYTVRAFDGIRLAALRDHIERVGIRLYTQEGPT